MNSTDFVIMVGFPFFSKAVILGIQNILEILLQDIEISKMESVVQQIILRLFLNLYAIFFHRM